jgi:hypothetical protein
MSEWKSFYKTKKQLMRDYVPGEDMTGISVADGETPKVGGKIAADDNGSQWYITPEFISENYEEETGYSPMECALFVAHIKNHLKIYEHVVCKICGKSIFDIVKYEDTEIS